VLITVAPPACSAATPSEAGDQRMPSARASGQSLTASGARARCQGSFRSPLRVATTMRRTLHEQV
jgi:hypothetical protein